MNVKHEVVGWFAGVHEFRGEDVEGQDSTQKKERVNCEGCSTDNRHEAVVK